MELRDFLMLLRKRWLTVALVTLLGAGLAAAAIELTPKSYESRTEVFISSQSGDTLNDLVQGGTFTQDNARNYSRLATTPLVLQPVVDQLSLSIDAEELAKRVHTTSPMNTTIIAITVADPDPEQARRIAAAVGTSLSKEIRSLVPTRTNGAPAVIGTTIAPATLPVAPASPNVKLLAALGLLLGLAGGLGLAIVRDKLDTRVRTAADVPPVVGASVMGTIEYDGEASSRPLVSQLGTHAPRAEAFRQVRTNLQFIRAGDRPQSIGVTSSVPGEGKSTTAANLAITLAAGELKVALVEGDLRRPKLGEYLGLEGSAGLTTVLIGEATLTDVLQPWGEDGLQVLLSGQIPPNPAELLGSAAMASVMKTLEADFDVVIVDCPPLLPVTDAAVLSTVTDATILVVGSGKVTRDQLAKAVDALAAVGTRPSGAILNLVRARAVGSYQYGYAPAGVETRRGKRR